MAVVERKIHNRTTENGTREPFSRAIEILAEQAKAPPGNDPAIGSFNAAVVEMTSDNPQVRKFLEDVYRDRKSSTASHFANLLFRATQFTKLFQDQDESYRAYTQPSEWKKDLQELLTTRSDEIRELLLTKDTVTTKYQRYAGPKALIGALWGQDPVKVADLGCGANYGLKGIELAEPFEYIEDQTPGNHFTKLVRIPINLEQGLAIDKQDPQNPESQAWNIACSYYPQELDQVGSTRELEQRLKSSRNVSFLKADLTSAQTLNLVPQSVFHATIVSTMLYQHPRAYQNTIIEAAKQATRQDGAIIIQDFAKKDPKNPQQLKFEEPWFNDFGYRTFLMRKDNPQPLEILQWSDGRNTTVRPGEDYLKIFG